MPFAPISPEIKIRTKRVKCSSGFAGQGCGNGGLCGWRGKQRPGGAALDPTQPCSLAPAPLRPGREAAERRAEMWTWAWEKGSRERWCFKLGFFFFALSKPILIGNKLTFLQVESVLPMTVTAMGSPCLYLSSWGFPFYFPPHPVEEEWESGWVGVQQPAKVGPAHLQTSICNYVNFHFYILYRYADLSTLALCSHTASVLYQTVRWKFQTHISHTPFNWIHRAVKLQLGEKHLYFKSLWWCCVVLFFLKHSTTQHSFCLFQLVRRRMTSEDKEQARGNHYFLKPTD